MDITPAALEPLFPPESRHYGELEDLAREVYTRSAELGGRLHPITLETIVGHLRLVNSYYSNRIEGHSTHPVDIERAIKADLSQDPAQRTLQLESRAHVEVQAALDGRLAAEPDLRVADPDVLRWLHQAFYEQLPEVLCWVTDPDTGERLKVEPGRLRERTVEVGEHVAPPAERLPAVLERFGDFYRFERFHGLQPLIAIAAAHHRIMWIHPFLDGNGRVARLMTDGAFRRIGVTGYGLWNVSRGLARRRDDYMAALAEADSPRRGDLDGRGNLSREGLTHFCHFFLETCLDQVDYMNQQLRLESLTDRIHGYVDLCSRRMLPGQPRLRPEAVHLLREVLLRGEISRGEAPRVTGLAERTARMVLRELLEAGLLHSESPKRPVRLGMPASVAPRWFPDLYPEATPTGFER
ncbi:MAG: Fic family protein [Gammaproteobacteria bacterium]|nr:Fic family protein [Gammaproteobacteria bacterium]